MLSKIILAVVAFSGFAQAATLEKAPASCEQKMVDVVFDKLGRYDETFSVYGYKVIYSAFMSNLAVVKTSDEVEPRDVLVSFSEDGKGGCNVKYKETLADGSTADIEVIELPQAPVPLKEKHFEVTGTIADVTSGEIDPFVIGDVCIVTLKFAQAPDMVLRTSQYECDDSALKAGQKVTVLVHKKDRIKDKEELSVLKEMFPAPRYYDVPFNQIKVVK